MVKIVENSTLSTYEKNKLKKEEEFLMIGKSDKSINVVSFGELIPIRETAAAITGIPSYLGQIAIVSGVGYMATGTASSADWKQITN